MNEYVEEDLGLVSYIFSLRVIDFVVTCHSQDVGDNDVKINDDTTDL